MKKIFKIHSKAVDLVDTEVSLGDKTVSAKVTALTMELVDQGPEENGRTITWIDVAPDDKEADAFAVGDTVEVSLTKVSAKKKGA